VEDDGAPGPGLWRAMRGMMDFRQATIADESPMGFKKQHRGGRQVREFRLWGAMTSMDKKILDQEEELNEFRKRPGGPPQDVDGEGPPVAKRARITRGPEAGIDLLEKMSQNDKHIFVKQEARGELDELPEIPAAEEEDEPEEGTIAAWERRSNNGRRQSLLDDRGKSKGKGKGKGGKRGGRDYQGWSHDDREGDDWDGKGGGKRGKRDGKGGKEGRRGKGGARPGPYDSGDQDGERKKGSGKGSALGDAVDATADELEKRAKRANRFKPQEPKQEEV